MSPRDEMVERVLQEAWRQIVDSACRESKLEAVALMREAHGQRSPERIREMEHERGLR